MSTYDSALLANLLANIHLVRAQNAVILSMLSKIYADDYNLDVDQLHTLQQGWIKDKAKEYGESDMDKMDKAIGIMQERFNENMPDLPFIDFSKLYSGIEKRSNEKE